MTDTNKENLVQCPNTPVANSGPTKAKTELLPKRISSLLFVANVDDSPGSEDEEITFKPSKRQLATGRQDREPQLESLSFSQESSPASDSQPNTAHVLMNSASRFEQVSARLDEWKKAMAGFNSPTTPPTSHAEVSPTPLISQPAPALILHDSPTVPPVPHDQIRTEKGPSISLTPEPEAFPQPENESDEVESASLIFDFSSQAKPSKRPAFIPGRHSRQLQEARALKKAQADDDSKPAPETSQAALNETNGSIGIMQVETPKQESGLLACNDTSAEQDSVEQGTDDARQSSSLDASPEIVVETPVEELQTGPAEDTLVAELPSPNSKLTPSSPTSHPSPTVQTTPIRHEMSSPQEDHFSGDEFCIPCTPFSAKVGIAKPDPEVADLKEQLAAVANANRHLENVISGVPSRGYEETFEQLVKEEQQKYEEEQRLRMALQAKNKELLEDMAAITSSFEQMKVRYEDFKLSNEAMHQQLETMRSAAEETEGALKEAEAGQEAWASRFDALKLHAQERLAAANAEIEELQRAAQRKDESLSAFQAREDALILAQRKQAAALAGRARVAEVRIAALEQERNELLLICEQLMGSLESPPALPEPAGAESCPSSEQQEGGAQ